MSILNEINGAKSVDLLVAFFDLTEFARVCRGAQTGICLTCCRITTSLSAI